MAAMSFEEWLPAPGHARGSHLIDFVEALLVRCEDLAEGRDWAQVAVDARGVLDAIRSAVAAEAPGIAVFDFASEFVHAHLTTVGAAFDGVDPLVAAVACARAVDDIWGDDLASEWAELLASRGDRIEPGDIVLSAGSDHITDLYSPGRAFSAPRFRAADGAARTRRAGIYRPQQGVPSVVVDRSLSRVLAPLLATGDGRARPWVAGVPNTSSAEWDFDRAPIRPRDRVRHLDAAERVVTDAFALDAAVVVLPEFSGYVDVIDRLRQARPQRPTLVVAGSGHESTGKTLRNVASTWIARPDGTIPPDQPIRTLKRVPYDGALGTEPLTEVASTITVQISGPWRMAIGICRDLCDPAITDALAQLGVNLLVVPACSPKTTNLARGAEAVAVDAGGFALVANGPPTFEQPNRPPAKVATAIWCTPLDRTEPRLMASTDTAGVVLVDLDGHRLIPNPWP